VPTLCRLGIHQWQAWHPVSVYRPDLGRAVRVRSRICERCGKTQEHVLRQKPEQPVWTTDRNPES
jgi:hypothetical protein